MSLPPALLCSIDADVLGVSSNKGRIVQGESEWVYPLPKRKETTVAQEQGAVAGGRIRGGLFRDKQEYVVTPLACSFCGKDKSRVERLIAGPNVFICNQCVVLCNEILAKERRGADRPPAKGD
jgi:hypothetical protein